VADGEASLRPRAQGPRPPLERRGALEQTLGVGEEDLPRGGELQPLAFAREEREPQLRLEREDLPAERRLRDVQLLRGAPDVLVLRDDDEVTQALEIDHARCFRTVKVLPRTKSVLDCIFERSIVSMQPITRTTAWPCTNSDSSSPAPLSTRRCIA